LNVYDITTRHDPTKCYSKTIDESKCMNWLEYNERVKAQAIKLERGIFAYRGNFYYAKVRTFDLSYPFQDESMDKPTTCRKIKFKWEYVFIK